MIAWTNLLGFEIPDKIAAFPLTSSKVCPSLNCAILFKYYSQNGSTSYFKPSSSLSNFDSLSF